MVDGKSDVDGFACQRDHGESVRADGAFGDEAVRDDDVDIPGEPCELVLGEIDIVHAKVDARMFLAQPAQRVGEEVGESARQSGQADLSGGLAEVALPLCLHSGERAGHVPSSPCEQSACGGEGESASGGFDEGAVDLATGLPQLLRDSRGGAMGDVGDGADAAVLVKQAEQFEMLRIDDHEGMLQSRFSILRLCFTLIGFENEDMSFKHCLLAASVAVMWGLNFLAIDLSLDQFPPFFLVALRFAVLALPALLFVPKPDVKFRWILGYGFGFGVLQFAFLYWAMATGMPTGLASLVLQASGPFTVLLGMTFLQERVRASQMVFLLVAMAGLGVVGWQRLDSSASFLPFLLTLAGAFGWAIGNISNRQAHSVEPVKFTMWMSIVPPLPMLLISLVVEGPAAIGGSMTTLGTPTGLLGAAGLIYTVVIATILGSGIWSWLMSRNPAGIVAPFSMLVPVVGMSAAWLVLGETVTLGELCGAVLIIIGVLGAGFKAAKGARILAVAEVVAPVSPDEEDSDGQEFVRVG